MNKNDHCPLFPKYETDPVGFAKDLLGVDLWERQRELLDACATNRRVACRSGHKIGKSRAVSVLALWWACTRESARVILLAPTSRQVRNILWREVRKLYNEQLGGTLYELPDRGIQWADGRELIGFSTDQPENLAGFSGPNMMFICDEASGIEEPMYEAMLGNMAGGDAKLVMISNPTRQAGTFASAFKDKSRFWTTLHVSSEETPNVTGKEAAIPGLATRAWIDEMREEWGTESPLYQVRVQGEFPRQAANAIIGLHTVETAILRWREWSELQAWPTGDLEIGVDPARFGDDESAVCARRGPVVLGLWTFRNLDTVMLASEVLELVRKHRVMNETPTIRVDEGGLGAGVVDQLKQVPWVSVQGINASSTSGSDQYSRLRDHAWFCLNDWLKSGGMIPDDNKLQVELVAPTYAFDVRGKIKVESKDEMKTRLKRSPDRADALALAVYRPPFQAADYQSMNIRFPTRMTNQDYNSPVEEEDPPWMQLDYFKSMRDSLKGR